MCDYEEYIFTCGCSKTRLQTHCHYARNDPNHQCFSVKKLRSVWDQSTMCDMCTAKHLSSAHQSVFQPAQQHYQ